MVVQLVQGSFPWTSLHGLADSAGTSGHTPRRRAPASRVKTAGGGRPPPSSERDAPRPKRGTKWYRRPRGTRLSDQPRPARHGGQSRSRSVGVCPFGRARRGHPYNRRSRQHGAHAHRETGWSREACSPRYHDPRIRQLRNQQVEGDTFSTKPWPELPIARSEPSPLAIPLRLDPWDESGGTSSSSQK